MKVHYMNILLFAVPLNILANTHKKPSIRPRHIQTTRLLCECELYMPNYDNDPEMKRVMQQFHDRTTQRFQEYDEKLQEKRQICKDTCDKEIQKIILKDKIEKELTEKFSSLHTDIQSDDIPTCICEKSLAEKAEKGCLRCGSILGAAMPEVGSIGGGLLYALNAWKPAAIIAAKEAAEKLGIAAGKVAGNIKGMEVVSSGLQHIGVHELFPDIFKNFVTTGHYNEITTIANSILVKYNSTCKSLKTGFTPSTSCTNFQLNLGIHIADGTQYGNPYGIPASTAIPQRLGVLLGEATQTAEAEAAKVRTITSSKIITEEEGVINTIYMSNQTAIIASIIAVVVIVLIMVIIYLILRYRRKKKMKKKLQYIKLLEE
ncbi:hypothetical protein PFBG_02321 [Plasmodium falciparum 7G8]|uniref:Rifin n=1 Tax=Plasmodium falciparum (isolate 7G8) TaxID=57266 RepID=W7FE54_PLAF8|nr:hypothetical protein PFBG_02321 [Plasmodium falciparum 7G8]